MEKENTSSVDRYFSAPSVFRIGGIFDWFDRCGVGIVLEII
jgi:hypothetical protein